jgi:hypothetical protein
MMALLSRLRRMDLEESGSPTKKQQRSRRRETSGVCGERPLPESPPPVFKMLAEKRKQERSWYSGSAGDGVRLSVPLSPHRKPEPVVNAATAPLREHLTFEISMLLPPPMDTRQSALQSPIQRKKRRKRLKTRRRRRRPTGAIIVDGKRTWQTSHTKWVPHASADYTLARAAEGVAATAGSKLVAKIAGLRTVVGGWAAAGIPPSAQRRTYACASGMTDPPRDRTRSRQREGPSDDNEAEDSASDGGEQYSGEDGPCGCGVIEEGEEEEEEEEEEEDEEGGDDDAESEEVGGQEDAFTALPDLLPSDASSLSRRRPAPLPSSRRALPLAARPVQTHQAAWISPELRVWLLHTHLFRTASH